MATQGMFISQWINPGHQTQGTITWCWKDMGSFSSPHGNPHATGPGRQEAFATPTA